LDGLEKQIDGNVGPAAVSVALEEVATGARIAEAAERAEGEVVLGGDAMEEISSLGKREGVEGGFEQTAEDG
jgi:hypothetical protein